MKSIFLFFCFFALADLGFVYADCSEILGGQVPLENEHYEFEREYYPLQLKMEVGRRPPISCLGDQAEVQKKMKRGTKAFNDFFVASRVERETFRMESWSHLDLTQRDSLNTFFQMATDLERQVQFPLQKFIYVLLPDSDKKHYVLKAGPAATPGGIDLALTKHVSLSEGKPVVSAGEFFFDSVNHPKTLVFSLKSGTYMSGASPEQQYRICLATERYLNEHLGDWLSISFKAHDIES